MRLQTGRLHNGKFLAKRSPLKAISRQCWSFVENSIVRVLDLSPKNVGQIRFGIKVEHGIENYEEVVHGWADVVLCTGSTICNGSITNFIDIGKDVVFFGITAAGAAQLMGWPRFCPLGH
jgi:hypothetical protein